MERAQFKIAILDDERSFLLLLKRILDDAGYTVKGATDAEEALKLVDQFLPDLVITDLKMPKMDGITFMERVKEKNAGIDFIMITAFATVETAVSAMKRGAVDYITKPLKDPEHLRAAVEKVFERTSLHATEFVQDIPPKEILFAGMESLMRALHDVSPLDTTIMLYGETGTGKSLIAKAVHSMSGRSGLFVDINCAVIPENLLESELFGYEKGAFTGAASQKRGKFELANDGTIFLDEVSEMSPMLQAKFLKVLQDRTFERLGSLTTIKTDARIIAATNRDLRTLVAEKKFREDLYYRLNVFPVTIPPLRERRAYIPEIARYLLQRIAARLGKEVSTIPGDMMRKLEEYSWPGNIRELENVIERGIITSRGASLTLPDFMFTQGTPEPAHHEAFKGVGDLKSVEKSAIERALQKTKGNRREAAELLGISLRALHYKIKEYGIA